MHFASASVMEACSQAAAFKAFRLLFELFTINAVATGQGNFTVQSTIQANFTSSNTEIVNGESSQGHIKVTRAFNSII